MRIGRLLLLIAFLAAQQAALAHEVWHAAKAQQNSQQGQLCDFHAALGTVSGAVDGTAPSPAAVDVEHIAFICADCAAITAQRVPPSSRGPPALF